MSEHTNWPGMSNARLANELSAVMTVGHTITERQLDAISEAITRLDELGDEEE